MYGRPSDIGQKTDYGRSSEASSAGSEVPRAFLRLRIIMAAPLEGPRMAKRLKVLESCTNKCSPRSRKLHSAVPATTASTPKLPNCVKVVEKLLRERSCRASARILSRKPILKARAALGPQNRLPLHYSCARALHQCSPEPESRALILERCSGRLCRWSWGRPRPPPDRPSKEMAGSRPPESSQGKVARHASRKVAPERSQRAPRLSESCPEVAEKLPRSPRFPPKMAISSPTLARFGQSLADVGQNWPMSANCGRCWPIVAEIWCRYRCKV